MSFKDSVTQTTKIGYFEGAIPVNYQYTFGIAGDKFFRTIMEKGDFVASKCPDCGTMAIYPLSYCEQCFAEVTEFVSVGLEGELYSFTECHYDFQGKQHVEPHIMGLIRFEGVDGGIIHRVQAGTGGLKLGMKVKAKLKPANEREGSVDDILYFEKA
ncbi:Zn-ribbon domain-containing OB-fold protein [bacterium]|nr:Zn-ribbon domain-containing OB-fold protein [bacterium]